MLAALVILGMLSGCGPGSGGADIVPGVEGQVLNIYVWNDEFQGKFNACYPDVDHLSNDKSVTFLKDGTEIHWVINPTQDGVYQQKLDEALLKQDKQAADDRVDMFLVEADYALKYIDPDANVAMPISELGITEADIASQYRYTLEAMTASDGEIRGLSYQATPGMLVYRRSIAKDVLGTDDPDVVGAAVADWDKFYQTADQMKAAGYYMYSGRADTYRVYSNNVSAPWVKNDKTVVANFNQDDSHWQEGVDASLWPCYVLKPNSDWNYALKLDKDNKPAGFSVRKKEWPADNFPFTLENVPFEFTATGVQVPSWGYDETGMTDLLPTKYAPRATTETTLKLVPMGAARLRISAFPKAE